MLISIRIAARHAAKLLNPLPGIGFGSAAGLLSFTLAAIHMNDDSISNGAGGKLVLGIGIGMAIPGVLASLICAPKIAALIEMIQSIEFRPPDITVWLSSLTPAGMVVVSVIFLAWPIAALCVTRSHETWFKVLLCANGILAMLYGLIVVIAVVLPSSHLNSILITK